MPQVLPGLLQAAETLWQQLEPLAPGFNVDVLPCVDSTNTRLLELARAGQTWPALLVALEQTAGRGRHGRTWWARPGDSLTFSLRLPVPEQVQLAALSGLSLAVGVVLADALSDALSDAPDDAPDDALAEPLDRSVPQGRLLVKWPNDLCLRQADAPAGLGKLGGILIESIASVGPDSPPAAGAAMRAVIIGVGLNLRGEGPGSAQAQAQTPAPAQGAVPAPGVQDLPWACLAQAGLNLDAGAALLLLAPALVKAWNEFIAHGLAPFVERYTSRDALAGRTVWVGQTGRSGEGADAESGKALGVDAQGRLLVHTARGLRALSSGEVSVRPLD